MDDLYKLVPVVGFIVTAATVYLRMYIAGALAEATKEIRAEIKLDYLTKMEAALLEERLKKKK